MASPVFAIMTNVIDFDNPTEVRLIHDYLRALKGKQRVEVKRYRPRRSDRANAFYFVAIVHPFSEWMSEQYGETFDEEDAHYLLKRTFLTRRVRHPSTGKVVEVVGSSAALDTAAFGEYVMKCSQLLLEHCGIVVASDR